MPYFVCLALILIEIRAFIQTDMARTTRIAIFVFKSNIKGYKKRVERKSLNPKTTTRQIVIERGSGGAGKDASAKVERFYYAGKKLWKNAIAA